MNIPEREVERDRYARSLESLSNEEFRKAMALWDKAEEEEKRSKTANP